MSSAPSFILASASPRRRELLERIGARFEALPAQVDEYEDGHGDPEGMVRHNALLKAAWVADRHRSRWVLGADTTVHLDGRVLSKPAHLAEARAMLKMLSGRRHAVYTGFALLCRDAEVEEIGGVRSEVVFRKLDDAIIDAYFDLVDPLDKAGAYGIQEGKELIIETFDGSLSNIMGLPMDETKALLLRHNLIEARPSRVY